MANVSEFPTDLHPTIPQLNPGSGEIYHAFISHHHSDLSYSEHLLENLEQAGFKCFHSERDFMPGETIVKNIEKGIKESRRVLVIVSQAMLTSSWVEFEIANSRSKANERREVNFIPILYDVTVKEVPAYIKEIAYLESWDPQFWQKLTKTLSESIPLADKIPAGNIAHGVAWSYYYGYLSLVLPGLVERTMQSEFASKGIPILPKMIVVIPSSCNCPGDPKKVDPNVTQEGKITFQATRAGKIGRNYSSSVYKVKDPDTGKEYYTILEYASSLMPLYEMEQGRIANLDRLEKRRQMKLFKDKMLDILTHPNNKPCHDKAVFVEIEDQDKDQRLSKVVAKRIEEELHRMDLENQTNPKTMMET